MPSIFTRIMQGELPSRMVWEDKNCVAFLSIAPVAPGHVLIVPRAEIDQWTDLDTSTWQAVQKVALIIGNALKLAFQPVRIGMLVAGFEVPHAHVHLFPANDMSGFDLSLANPQVNPAELDAVANKIRDALVELIEK